MNIHEYQAKRLLSEYGVPVPRGGISTGADEAVSVARDMGGSVWVVKAQIHAGGRGKGGGVRVAKSLDEVRTAAGEMTGMTLVTPQTGPGGRVVRQLYVEEGCDIARELYVGLLIDRATSRVTLMASTEGGMEIEEVAAATPEKIHIQAVDPATGIRPFHARRLASALELEEAPEGFVRGLYDAFTALDASVLEINPLVVTGAGSLVALDAKMNFDDNALYRQRNVAALRDPDEEDPMERAAAEHDLNYIRLDGNIGCMVNGAGLAMATMDIIRLHGGAPANFLDVGGGATRERVTTAFKLILSDEGVASILVNIFGGIMRCDVIAEGVVAAAREVGLKVPLVVRLAGTNVDLGKKILEESGLPVIAAGDLSDAAAKAVRVTAEAA